MSGNKNLNTDEERDALAFEYVSGTLRSEERVRFDALLIEDEALQKSVRFWEERLMGMQPKSDRPPAPRVWENISSRINVSNSRANNDTKISKISKFWQWFTPSLGAAALTLAITIFIADSTFKEQLPNTDYVAVLTDDSGRALLTALTAESEKNMWLKWEVETIKPGTNAQLWAVSKRDGQTRPIAVLDSTQTEKLQLDDAKWRLVTDAEFLILTEEEPGGSAIDEPSDTLLGKGFCVRFTTSPT